MLEAPARYVYVAVRWQTMKGADRWKVEERFIDQPRSSHAIFGGFRDEEHARRIASALNAANEPHDSECNHFGVCVGR